jgi:hypothetical protein
MLENTGSLLLSHPLAVQNVRYTESVLPLLQLAVNYVRNNVSVLSSFQKTEKYGTE